MLGEARAESSLQVIDRLGRLPALVAAASRPLSARSAVVGLSALAVASIALRIVFALQVKGPFFFMDELGYERMAASIARHGDIALFGKSGLAYSPLYSVLLAPVYALTSSVQTAYDWVRIVNAVLMSLSAFPVYAIARFVLSRRRALGVAALSLVAPLMFYSELELSESLAYPLFLVAIWTMLRTVRTPSVRNDLLFLAAVVLASAARLQQIALVPAALTAILLVALLGGESSGQRLRSVRLAIARHRLLFGSVTTALVAVVLRTMTNGGSLPLAGRYSEVGHARANPLHVLEIAAQHAAELDFALGIIPFAGALLAAYALVRFGFPRRQLIFAAVAVSTTVWLLLEVGFDAAAFDNPHLISALPRIHERYLIYLVPLFLVALVAALRAPRTRIGSRAHLLVAAAAVALPAAIPFASVVNYTIPVESFGLQIFGTNRRGTIAPIPHAAAFALGVGVVFALAYLYALLRPRPSFAIIMTVVAFLILSSLVRLRIIGAAQTSYAAVPTHVAWVDRAAQGDSVVLIGGRTTHRRALRDRAALLDTAFRNLDVSRVYFACKPIFGVGFGEKQIAAGPGGVLRDADGVVHAAYAVVPSYFGVQGRILAREQNERLVLVAPAGGVLTVAAAPRGLCGA
jgi:hypothetical protein